MNPYVQMYDENEGENAVTLLRVSSKRTFPLPPFPRKYVHCVIDDLDCMVRVVHALRADGHGAAHIHVMSCWDYVAAVEQRYQQQSRLSKILARFLSLLDEGFGDIYLRAALRGNHVLMVRLSRYERIKRVRDMLMLHNAHIIKYVDTWTVTDLSPSLERG